MPVCGNAACEAGESVCSCAIDCGVSDCPIAPTIDAGIDLWETPPGGTTFQDFALTPLPPGFFDSCAPPLSSSDPFGATIVFGGQPLPTFPPGILGPTDTIVRRLEPLELPLPGAIDTVPIEIVALSLHSVQPIVVTYNGGTSPETWIVRACLSDQPQQSGTMTVERGLECEGFGGTFNSTLPVQPKLIFVRPSDLCTIEFDGAEAGLPPLEFATPDGHWLPIAPPHLNLIQEPLGGVQVDGNCDGFPDPQPLPPTGDFHPGLRLLRCPGSACDGSQPVKRMTLEQAQLAQHGVLPAEAPAPDVDSDGVPDPGDNCAPPLAPPLFNPEQTDSDDDGIGDACDNCPQQCNVGQQDGDGDLAGDVCDCAPADGGNPAPGPVADAQWSTSSQLNWSPEPGAVVYDVVRGPLSGLPVGPGNEDEICFGGIEGESLEDPATPLSADGGWYDVRAINACGQGPWGESSAGTRLTSTCDETFYLFEFDGDPMQIVTDSGATESSFVGGALLLDGFGHVKELDLRATEVPTLAGPTGLMTIALDASAPQVGGFVGDSLSIQFGLTVNTAIADQNLPIAQDDLRCMGGEFAGAPCSLDNDCFDGACELPGGYCACDSDTAFGPTVSCSGQFNAARTGSTLTGTFEFLCQGAELVNSGVESGEITTTTDENQRNLQDCPEEKRCKLKKVCIQPIVIAQDDGSAPSSCPSMSDVKSLWKDCCIEVEVKATKTIKKSAYRTLDESKNDTPTAELEEIFKEMTDDDGTGGCIEIYCAKSFAQDGKTSKDISGGGACYHAGTAKCKVIVVEGGASTLPAHEVGHCFGLSHSDDGGTIMEPTGKHDTAGNQKTRLAPCKKAHGGNVGSETAENCCKDPDLE